LVPSVGRRPRANLPSSAARPFALPGEGSRICPAACQGISNLGVRNSVAGSVRRRANAVWLDPGRRVVPTSRAIA
jgi:hypothetical protein